MSHLIDKDAAIAVIEDYKNNFCDRNGYLEDSETNGLAYDTLCDLEGSIDALEVKEVDYAPIDNDFERDAVQFCFDNGLNTTPRIAKTIAKHFFELGMSVSNPTTALDKGMAEEIILALKRVQQDYCISLDKEIKWLQDKIIN